MTKLKTVITKIVGDKDHIDTERYFMTVACFSASIFLLVLCIVHIIMNLKLGPVFIAGISSLVLMGLYYFVRFKKCLFYPKLVLTIWGLVMLDLTWYSKYLSNGPVLFYILIFGALVIWVWEGKSLAVMLSIYFLNVAILFVIDYTASEDLFIYPDLKTRSVDIFLSFFLYSSLMIFLLYIVKKDFIRQKEKAIKSDKLKTAFLANMSHEIRTPMNAIVGFSQLLSNGKNLKNQKTYTRIIQNSSNDLLRLINDIIDLSKIEVGDMEIKYSDFSIENLFTELKEFYNIELSKRDKSEIMLEFRLPDGDFIIHSDSLRLKQVISNLLSNAIKFTKRGEIYFSCEKKKNELIFSVSDTGIGIPEEDQGKIFEQFSNFNYQDLNSEGSGIGLSIVVRILALLKGRIWLESFPGGGSCFNFSIPYIAPKIKSKPLLTKKNQQSPDNESRNSILIVEDNELSSMLISTVLSSLNYEYHHVTSGLDAVDYIKANPDTGLVLMDLKLPGMDGYEATKAIKKMNPNPIIAQTAFAMSTDREKAINAGCDDYIPKPIDFKKLHELIRIYL